ncbi:MAG: ATP-binding protein, partial [Patescibacteria group bacterium]|nr:ATP-binding protein [Patescibacteria group bacterium]
TLVIDEFPYLIKANKSFPYIFQKIIDKQLRDQEVNVIVSGSSMSLMSDKVLAHKSPLYGRRTAQLRLDPLEFKHMKEFFPKYSREDLVKVYTAVGGVPYYIEQFDKSKTPEENFQRLFLQKSGLLYEEVDILLESELRDVKNYKFILKKIAQGAQKMGEISEDTGFKSTSLTWYLDVLEKIGFVKKSKPLFSKPQDRSTLYVMNDQYMKFWFHFIHDSKMEVERGIRVRLSKTRLAKYIGDDFSGIVSELVSDKFQIYFDTQWGTCTSTVGNKIMLSTYSIDLVGVDNEKKILRIFDVEWKDLSVAQVHDLINDLKKKSEFLPRKYRSWEKVYGVVAKSVESGDYDGDVFGLKDLM